MVGDYFAGETPQRQKYILGELKQIMRDNNLKSFNSLLTHLENPETPKETDWSIYINNLSDKSLKKMKNVYYKKQTPTQKIKEKLIDSDKFKSINNEKYIYDGKKYGYSSGKRKEIIIEKTLYRGEFRIIARTKDGKFASFIKK